MTSVPTDMPESLYLLSEDYDGPDDELQDKLIQSLYPAKAPAYELAPIYRKVTELTREASRVSSIEQMNEYLLSVNSFILRLCGNSDWHTAPRAVDGGCYFLGNTPLRGSFGSGCKTDEEIYKEKNGM
jgi:hypothetical protein